MPRHAIQAGARLILAATVASAWFAPDAPAHHGGGHGGGAAAPAHPAVLVGLLAIGTLVVGGIVAAIFIDARRSAPGGRRRSHRSRPGPRGSGEPAGPRAAPRAQAPGRRARAAR